MADLRAHPGSITFRICIFFALNPDEELTTSDISEKTGGTTDAVTRAMRQARDNGMVSVGTEMLEGSRMNLYRAGPTLLAMIGRAP
jgi:hypothetical protein